MKHDSIVIINFLSKKGKRVSKEFHEHGRPVIGICTPESLRGVEYPLSYITQLMVNDDTVSMASIACMINHCDAILC